MGIDIVGNVVYMTNYVGHSVQIINVTNKSSPAFLGQILDGPTKLMGGYNVFVE